MNWFSSPEISKVTKMPILKILDGDHLFVYTHYYKFAKMVLMTYQNWHGTK